MNPALAALACAVCVAVTAWWMGRQVAVLKGKVGSAAIREAELSGRIEAADKAGTQSRSLFDSVPVAIVISRFDGGFIDVNRAAVSLFGFGSREELMRLNMRALYVNPAERDKRVQASLTEVTVHQGEHMLRRKDGSTFPALSQTHSVRDAAGKPDHIEGFVTDMSQYKRLEEDRQAMEHEQRISQRLKSVGALAAGIAHEINTPMQFVSDSVYFLKTAVGELDALWPDLAELTKHTSPAAAPNAAIERIEATLSQIGVDQLVVDANQSAERALEGIRRVTKIIRAMREFAHPDNGEHSLVDINNAIETTLTVCKNVYKEVAQVETHFGPLPAVTCQYGEINQVFLNIIVNAAHAIEANKSVSGNGLIRITTEVEDSWAVIRIQDNGTGIPESVKARIFDPFFTTKEVGKGTGQGLAIAQSVVVERHRGRISVESEIGKGTTFILRLPIEDRTANVVGSKHEQEA
jgi:PAS domain S-box-containing protein